MAGRISSCMNLHLPLLDSISAKSSPPPLLKTSSHISCRRTEDDETEPPQKKKCSFALTVAASTVIMIGVFQVSEAAATVVVKSPVREITAPRKWSDKRACPPWSRNSLETIVPENLPRPSSHRRLELAGLGKHDAPVIGEKVTRVNVGSCFSM